MNSIQIMRMTKPRKKVNEDKCLRKEPDYETTGRMLKCKSNRTDRQTFRLRLRWEVLIHIWISPCYWKVT